MTTVVRNASWIVAYDPVRQGHAYLHDGDVAFSANRLVTVGGRHEGPVTREIDGRGMLVLPGLVNVHSHPSSEPMNKGWNDELGTPRLYNSGLYEIMPVFRPDAAGVPHAARVAWGELLLSGVTTLVDLSVAWDGWVEAFADSGLRGIVAPMYRSARWLTDNGYLVKYEWDEKAGERAFAAAMSVVDAAVRHP